MRLEHKHEKVIPLPHFIRRLTRFGFVSLFLIIISLGVGVVGYHTFGSISYLDSFHMACMILTGMGPVVEMQTESAKLFSSFYALFGSFAFFAITAVFFTPVIHRIFHIVQAEHEEL